MNESDREIASAQDWLHRVSIHPRVPAGIRRLALRIGQSSLASRLAHGAFWSLAGATLSRVLTLAASVATARILGKHLYGEFGVLSSTLMMLQVFASLGLGLTATRYVAELRVKDKKRAGRILALSAVAGAITGLLSTVLLWVFAPWLAATTLGAPQLTNPLRIAALGLLFTSLGGAQSGALAGFEAFRTATRMNVYSGLVGLPIAVLGVYFWGITGAAWATVATAFVQWLLTHFAVRGQASQHGITFGYAGWWHEHRVLWTFSLPALATNIMVAPVSWAAAAVLVNRPNGFAEMGAFSAANQWFGAVMFLPSALGGAVLPVLSERVGQGDASGTSKVLRAAMALNGAVVIPIVVMGSLASPWIMGLYGSEFRSAWPTLIVVLITAGLVAATNPVGAVLSAASRLWLAFSMNTGWAVVYLAMTVILVNWGSFGISSARLLAYLLHGGWTVWFAVRFVRGVRRSGPTT